MLFVGKSEKWHLSWILISGFSGWCLFVEHTCATRDCVQILPCPAIRNWREIQTGPAMGVVGGAGAACSVQSGGAPPGSDGLATAGTATTGDFDPSTASTA